MMARGYQLTFTCFQTNWTNIFLYTVPHNNYNLPWKSVPKELVTRLVLIKNKQENQESTSIISDFLNLYAEVQKFALIRAHKFNISSILY